VLWVGLGLIQSKSGWGYMNDISNAIAKHEELYYLLSPSKFVISEYKEIDRGLQFFVQKEGWSGSIKIYQHEDSNVKIDFSQLDKSRYSLLVKTLAESKKSTLKKKSKPPTADRQILPAIGCAPIGKADYFGSLVMAGIYVDRKTATQLAIAGVKDSKTLGDTKIEVVAREIRRICQDKFVIVEISPTEYNQRYDRLEVENKSLNDLLIENYVRSIDELLSKVSCETAIVDKLVDENLLLEQLQSKGRAIKIVRDLRSENHLAIEAASILAKDRFISNLRKLGKQYKVNLPKGSSKAAILVAKQLVSAHGIEVLGEVAKLHFKTTKEVLI
jgi:ribonuclease HIII